MSDQIERESLANIPPAVPTPGRARDFVRDIPAVLRRWNRMARAARLANKESMAAEAAASRADGFQLSEARIWRLENKSERSELDVFALLYTLLRGGYSLYDLYPPAADTELSDDERTLLRHYRAAQQDSRTRIIEHAAFVSQRSSLIGPGEGERPPSIRELRKQRKTGAESEGTGKSPRRFYGKGNGTNGTQPS